MARHYGIPYMGSKQKLVDKIVPFILKRHPDTTSFYDLFGGGGSVALYAVRKYPKLNVHYNELSTAVGGLLQYLKDGGELPTEFVKRSEFERKYTGDDWYAGLLQTCWTFGNNQKSYLYGMDIQDFKEALTELVMTGKGDIKYIEEFTDTFIAKEHGKTIKTRIFINANRYNTPYQRRIILARQIEQIGALQHLARIERLMQIQDMPGLNRLNITAGQSYLEVPIIERERERVVVYCDPPYEGTAEYREGGFNHKEFYDWVASRTYPVYFNSYKISDTRFKIVKAINTRSLLAAAYSDKPTYNYENIYWNGVGL